ncbi:hypothetical protein LTR85_000871 [Meristemomyces frigidus]|nr:hypothetical protein LTR85_000871 [Meristemomyces frigidus]
MSTTELFKRTHNDTEDRYWDTYLAVRPKYDRSGFYDRILDYHRQRGNDCFDSAHDLACGPAQVAGQLAKHFTKVTASDANAAHIDSVRAQSNMQKNITLLHCSTDQIADHAAPGSVDLVTVAEAMPLMDMSASLTAFRTILKPGGTLAMWFYGRPHVLAADGEALDATVNEAYTKLADYLMTPSHPAGRAMFRAPMQHMHSWFDDVGIPAAQWDDVQRWKWNFDCEMPFSSMTACGLDGSIPESQVGAHEECVSTIDRRFWAGVWTADDAKRFLSVNLPNYEASRFESEEYARLCAELEKAMGDEGVERQVAWPVILVLATARRGSPR